MSNWIICQLILKESKIFAKNKLIYFLNIYVLVESYRSISQFLSNGVQNNLVFDIHQEALIRGSVFPLVIFLLLSGYILFSHFRRERLPEYASLFFSKPVKTYKIILSRYIAVTIIVELFYLISYLLSVTASIVLLGLSFNLIFFLEVYILLPFFAIIVWNILILLLTMVSTDFRVGLPVIFLLWFLSQLLSQSFLIEYDKILKSNLILDNYLLINRGYWLMIAIFLLYLSTLMYNRYRNGWEININLFSNRTKDKNIQEEIKLGPAFAAEIFYSIKIYSGWRILAALLVSVILALIYSLFVPGQIKVYLFLGTGEIFLALLAILGASGISNIEREKNTISYIASLPFTENRLLKQKLMVSCVYFLVVYLSYTICGVVFIGLFIAKMTWILIPTYLLFTTLVLILSKTFNSTLIGGMTSGIIWFLPIVLGRKFPCWLHPYYYFAEFDHFHVNFLMENKIILLLISMLLMTFFLFRDKICLSSE